MKFKIFKKALKDMYIDVDNNIASKLYDLHDISKSKDDKIVMATQHKFYISIDGIWMHHKLRKQGIATKFLESLKNIDHGFIVDERNVEMHSLAKKLNYKESNYDIFHKKELSLGLDNSSLFILGGGDKFYYKMREPSDNDKALDNIL